MVRGEGPRRGAAVDGLQHGRFHLQVAARIQKAAHRAEELGALPEDGAHVGVHREVDVALAVAEFLIRHLVVRLALRFLHHRKRAKRLAEQRDFFDAHGYLAHPRAEDVALNAHDVANVPQLTEDLFVERLAHVVFADVGLDGPRGVLHVEEGGPAHHADRRDAPGNGDVHTRSILRVVRLVVERVEDVSGVRIDVPGVRVRVDAARLQLAALFAAALFLFTAVGGGLGHGIGAG